MSDYLPNDPRIYLSGTIAPSSAIGGGPLYLFELSRRLPARGLDVRVISPVDVANSRRPSQFNVEYMEFQNSTGISDEGSLRQTVAFIRRIRQDPYPPQLIHYNQPQHAAIALRDVATVSTFHGPAGKPLEWRRVVHPTRLIRRSYVYERLRVWWRTTAHQFMLRRADMCFFVSAFCRDEVLRRSARSLDPNRHRVHYLGCDTELFRPVNISKFDYSNNIPTLTFVSGIGIYTRHEKLIEIFARIVQRIPTVQLLLVGPDSDGLSRVLETIHRLGLTDKVTITGLLPHDELPKYLGRADVYISARPETFGVNIIEAMACGLPIVSFKQSALPELVRNEVDGHLVETDEEFIERVLLLLQDRRLAHTMGKNGRQRVLEMFTWKRVIDRVVEGYALALENFERRRRKSTST